MGAKAGGSGGGKATSGTADRGKTRRRHWAGKQHGGGKGGSRGWECDDPWGVGGKSRGHEASVVGFNPHGVEGKEGGREASGVEKPPKRVHPTNRRGRRIVTGKFDPQRRQGT